MKKQKDNGITLIALVITIIMLLILAGVTISGVLSENGLFNKAKQSTQQYQESSILEDIQLKIYDEQMNGTDLNKKSNLFLLLSQYGKVNETNGEITSVTLNNGSEIPIERIFSGKIVDDKPVFINTKEDLEDFRDNVNNGNTYEGQTVILLSDIDLQCSEDNEDTWWIPIGFNNKRSDIKNNVIAYKFKGTFNGNNHKISNIYMKQNCEDGNQLALFSTIEDATIKSITVSGTSISVAPSETNSPTSGGIVGETFGKCLVENCTNEVNVSNLSNTRAVGGIIVSSYGEITIKNCKNLGNISGARHCGGIIGSINTDSTLYMENCSNEGKVKGDNGTNNCTGGIIGRILGTNSTANFNNNSNTGEVNGFTVGGCIGWSDGTINVNNFSNTGNISATSAAGGCIASNRNKAILTNIVNKCEITKADAGVGGLIGYSGLTPDTTLIISNSYNTSQVISMNRREAGGIISDSDSATYLINVYNTGDCTTQTTTSTRKYRRFLWWTNRK